MRISQRGTSFTGLTSGSQYGLDRFQLSFSGSGNGTWTMSQDTDAPAGFNNSLKMACTTSGSSTTDNYIGLYQIIEGYNVADLAWGTPSAKPVTVSFWIKSTRTGNLLLELYKNRNASRLITINNANTWEYKTFTFQGDTVANVMDTGNSYGIYVNFFMALGTNYKTTALHTEFGAYDSTARATGLQNLLTSGDSCWITGVQFEVGQAATAFEYRPYTTELQLCQRYCQKVMAGLQLCKMRELDRSRQGHYTFPVQMRTTATVGSMATTDSVSLTVGNQSDKGFSVYGTVPGDGYGAQVDTQALVTAEL
jgi:hypothetical protein